jgi:hypothetical protein
MQVLEINSADSKEEKDLKRKGAKIFVELEKLRFAISEMDKEDPFLESFKKKRRSLVARLRRITLKLEALSDPELASKLEERDRRKKEMGKERRRKLRERAQADPEFKERQRERKRESDKRYRKKKARKRAERTKRLKKYNDLAQKTPEDCTSTQELIELLEFKTKRIKYSNNRSVKEMSGKYKRK